MITDHLFYHNIPISIDLELNLNYFNWILLNSKFTFNKTNYIVK